MSVPVPPLNVNSEPTTPSSPPPGGISTSATPSAPAAPARFGENAPAWARGKTAEEVLGIADQMVQSFGRTATPPPAPPPAPDPNARTVGDDDYITGKDLRTILASATRQVEPAINQGVELGASANLAYVRRDHADVFQRYGPEIAQKLATVPKHLWSLDNLETIVKLVKVDHLDDIVREQAQRVASTMEPTIRSNVGGGSGPVPVKEHSLESEQIPGEWKQRALQAGVTEATVREFCASNEITPEQFYKQFEHLGKYEGQRNPIIGEIGRAKSA